MIKPTKAFRAVVTGSAYPATFTPEDALDPACEAAKAALDLGLLSKKDAATVRKALEADADAGANPDPDPDADATDPDGSAA